MLSCTTMNMHAAATASARLHNVLAQFENNDDVRTHSQLSRVPLDDAWSSVQLSEHVVALVAGSMTLDIIASTGGDELPQPGTTLPGKVSQQPGGVARNIADALSRLIPARSVKLVSVVGKDAAGSALLRLWDNHNGRSTSGILVHSECRTATVSTIMAGNEIHAGIADTGIVEEGLQAAWILQHVAEHPSCKLLVLDTNLTTQDLKQAAQACWHQNIIVFVDPVSVFKSTRCLPLLQYIDVVKPGAAELQEMCKHICHSKRIPLVDPPRSRQFGTLLSASQPITSDIKHLLAGLVVQCWMLLRQGLGTVLLSLGCHGCAVCQLMHAKEARERVPLGLVDHSDSRASVVMIYCASRKVRAVSTTGAGDCLVAGTLAGVVHGLGLGDAACLGAAAAAESCRSSENVPEGLCWEGVVGEWEGLRDASVAMLWAVDPAVLRKDMQTHL